MAHFFKKEKEREREGGRELKWLHAIFLLLSVSNTHSPICLTPSRSKTNSFPVTIAPQITSSVFSWQYGPFQATMSQTNAMLC